MQLDITPGAFANLARLVQVVKSSKSPLTAILDDVRYDVVWQHTEDGEGYIIIRWE